MTQRFNVIKEFDIVHFYKLNETWAEFSRMMMMMMVMGILMIRMMIWDEYNEDSGCRCSACPAHTGRMCLHEVKLFTKLVSDTNPFVIYINVKTLYINILLYINVKTYQHIGQKIYEKTSFMLSK